MGCVGSWWLFFLPCLWLSQWRLQHLRLRHRSLPIEFLVTIFCSSILVIKNNFGDFVWRKHSIGSEMIRLENSGDCTQNHLEGRDLGESARLYLLGWGSSPKGKRLLFLFELSCQETGRRNDEFNARSGACAAKAKCLQVLRAFAKKGSMVRFVLSTDAINGPCLLFCGSAGFLAISAGVKTSSPQCRSFTWCFLSTGWARQLS